MVTKNSFAKHTVALCLPLTTWTRPSCGFLLPRCVLCACVVCECECVFVCASERDGLPATDIGAGEGGNGEDGAIFNKILVSWILELPCVK